MTDGFLTASMKEPLFTVAISQPSRAMVEFPTTSTPWWETAALAFRLLVSRAADDAEIREFLTESKVIVTDLDGSTLWPK